MKTALAVALAALAALCAVAYADTPMTVEQAEAVGKAINLTTADMVGYDVIDHVTPPANTPNEVRLRRCMGGDPPFSPIGEVNSDDFYAPGSGPVAVAFSNVVVFASSQQAQQAITFTVSKRTLACARKYGFYLSRGMKLVKLTITRLRAPAPGVTAVRSTLRSRQGKAIQTMIADSFSFARGPVVVTLATLAMSRPFGAGRQSRLLNLLITRAAQQLPSPNLALGASPSLEGQ